VEGGGNNELLLLFYLFRHSVKPLLEDTFFLCLNSRLYTYNLTGRMYVARKQSSPKISYSSHSKNSLIILTQPSITNVDFINIF
jgi:hypothetical protein